MTAPDVNADVRACPFCGNAKMEIHHNTQVNITFLLCGDDRGRDGCGAVVSFRPNLTGSKAVQAYNRRAARSDLAGEVRELEIRIKRLAAAIVAPAVRRTRADEKRWGDELEVIAAALAKFPDEEAACPPATPPR